MDKETIKSILLAHGFTIKQGEADLKPYVYAAASAIYEAALQAAQPKWHPPETVQGEPVAWSGWGCQHPGKMPRLYGERRIAELNCDWENGDQVLYFTAAPQPAEQQPVPVFSDEDHVSMPRGLIAAACSAINKKRDAENVLSELRRYTLGDLSRQTEPDVAGLVDALDGAARSLEMISKQAGIDEYMCDFLEARGYARSRAMAALEALAAYRNQGDES